MKFLIQGTGVELTPSIKQYIEEKIGSLNKFLKRFDQDIISAQVEVGKIKSNQRHGEVFRAEVNLSIGGDLLRAENTAESIQAAIDFVKDDLSDKIKSYKEKKETKAVRGARSWKKFWQISPLARFKKPHKTKGVMDQGKEKEE